MAVDYGELGSAKIALRVDFATLGKDLSKAEKVVDSSAKKIGDQLTKFGAGWSAAISAPIAGLTAATLVQLNRIDSAFDQIRASTGATGKALAGLKGDFAATLAESRSSIEDVGAVVSDLHVRTGLTGDALRELSLQFVNLKDVAGEDGAALIGSVTRVFGDWSVATEQQAHTMDLLFRANQKTGASIALLSDQTVKYGAPLRQLGFGLEQAIALFGKWEKEGVNTEIVMSGVRQALSRMAQAGIKDVPAAFQAMIQVIEQAGTAGEANALSMQFFGAKAGPDMAAAIREGRFAIGGLVADLAASTDTINAVAKENEGLWEVFVRMGNRITAELSKTQDQFDSLGGTMVPVFEKITDGIVGVIAAFNNMDPKAQGAVLAIGAVAAAIGPLLVGLGALLKLAPLIKTAFLAGFAGFLPAAATVGIVALAIVDLGLVVNAFVQTWKLFGRDFKAVVKDFSDYWGKGVTYISEGWQEIRRELRQSDAAWAKGLNSMLDNLASFGSQTLSIFAQIIKGIGTLGTSMEGVMRAGASWMPDWLQNITTGIGSTPGPWNAFMQEGEGLREWMIQMGQGWDIFKESLAGDPDFLKGGILDQSIAQVQQLKAGLGEAGEALKGMGSMAAPDLGALDAIGGGKGKKIDPLEEWTGMDEKLAQMERGLEIAQALDDLLLSAEDKAISLRQSVNPDEAALAQLHDLQTTIASFPGMFDETTISLLSGEIFKTLAANSLEGAAAIDEVVASAGNLNPVFASAGNAIRDSLEKTKAIDRLKDTGGILEQIGGIAGDLPGQFRKFGQVVQSTGRIVQASARLMAGDFTAIISILAEMVSMMGLFGDQSQEEAKGIGKIMDDIGEAAQQWGEQLTDILVDFVRTGTLSFEDLANQIINDLLRITIQAAIVDPLIDFGGDLLGFDKGAAFSDGKMFKAADGIVTRRSKIVTPGGLGVMGEGRGPGEAVVPLSLVGGHLGIDATGVGGGGDMVVEVYNTGSAPVATQQSVDGDGVRRMKMFVHNVVNEGLSGGQYDPAMAGFYGLARRGQRG